MFVVLLVAVTTGCTPCADPPAVGVDHLGALRVFVDEDTAGPEPEVVGMSRWEVVRSLGPTPRSEGGFVAVETHRWGQTATDPTGEAAEVVLVDPCGLAFTGVLSCPAPDPVPELGAVRYRPVFAEGTEPEGAHIGPDALVPLAEGTPEDDAHTALDRTLGEPVAVEENELPLAEWDRRVERPRTMLTLLLGLVALAIALASIRVTRDDLRAGAARPFPSIWSAVVWTITGGFLVWLGVASVSSLSAESMIDTQPNDILRAAGCGLAILGLLVFLARPWFPATCIVWSMAALVGASALTLGAGPWLFVVPFLAGAARLRRSDLVDGSRVAVILIVGTVAIGGTMLSGWGLWVGGILLFCSWAVGDAASPQHVAGRPAAPSRAVGAPPTGHPTPDAAVGHPEG